MNLPEICDALKSHASSRIFVPLLKRMVYLEDKGRKELHNNILVFI